jgi:hypothetical protein
MLKCNVLTCLESHHMVFEDIGQQLIYDDEYLTPIQVGTAYGRLGSDSGDVSPGCPARLFAASRACN